MNDIFELIFALVAGFFWLFGSSFFKRRGEEEPHQPTTTQRNSTEEQTPYDAEQTRQQEIRDAIRRKIAERRQQADVEPVVVVRSEPQQRESYDLPFESEVSEETVYQNLGTSPYEQEMQERLLEIEETKRQSEALKKKLTQQKNTDSKGDLDGNRKPQEALFSGSIQSILTNSQNIRTAFICKEILGKPVGLQNLM